MRLPLRLLALALAATPAAGAGAPRADDAEPSAQAVLAALAELRAGTLTADDARERIAALGPPAVDALLALRTGRVTPVTEEGAAPPFDARGQALILDALRSLPADQVGARLAEAFDGTSEADDNLVAVQLVGELGDLRSLGAMLTLYSQAEPRLLARPRLQELLKTAMARVLEREPEAVGVMRTFVPRVAPALLPAVARALAEAPGIDNFRALSELLDRSDELNVVVLSGLANAGPRALAREDGARADVVRAYLSSDHPGTRLQAAAALAALRDAHSFVELLALFEDPDRAVQVAALRACQQLSGLRWPAEEDRWRRWYQQEARWLDRQAPALERQARHGDPAAAVAALRELSEHRLHGRELVPHLAAGLDHPSERVVLAALAGFARLGEPGATPTLIDLLADPRSDVRRAAHDTLRALTGEDLPDDVDAWYDWLGW